MSPLMNKSFNNFSVAFHTTMFNDIAIKGYFIARFILIPHNTRF